MRVLMICWEYPPHLVGGMGRHAAELVPELTRLGVEVHLITPHLRESNAYEAPHDLMRVYRVPAPAMNGHDFDAFVGETNIQSFVAQARALFAQLGSFDLIHAHDWLSARSAIELKQRYRVPLVATIHATERGRAQGRIDSDYGRRVESQEWELLYQSWRAIVCSHFMAGHVRETFQVPEDKLDVIANGVRVVPSPFADQGQRLAFRRRFAADDEPLIFTVGRVVFEKGHHLLIDAMPAVLDAFPGARLVVAGRGSCLDDVKRQARERGVAGRVSFVGFISDEDRDRLYHVADAAVFPSLYEPFGIVALEAMAANCPVVVAETGGLAEVVDNHETGIVVAPNDAGALAWGIIHTLRHPEWSRQRAANGLQLVKRRYAWEDVAADTHAVYQRVRKAWLASDWKAHS